MALHAVEYSLSEMRISCYGEAGASNATPCDSKVPSVRATGRKRQAVYGRVAWAHAGLRDLHHKVSVDQVTVIVHKLTDVHQRKLLF